MARESLGNSGGGYEGHGNLGPLPVGELRREANERYYMGDLAMTRNMSLPPHLLVPHEDCNIRYFVIIKTVTNEGSKETKWLGLLTQVMEKNII